MAEPSVLQKKTEIFLERDIYPLLKNFPASEKFSLCQEIKQSCYKLIRAAVMANNLTNVNRRLMWLDEADAEKTLLLVLLGVAKEPEVHHAEETLGTARKARGDRAHHWRTAKVLHQQPKIDHQKKYSTYSGLSLSGVEPCDSRVQFGPQLEQQQCYELQPEPRFPPRLVGYYVICGHGFRCVSLLYFKGEVILRHVEKRRKNSD